MSEKSCLFREITELEVEDGPMLSLHYQSSLRISNFPMEEGPMSQ